MGVRIEKRVMQNVNEIVSREQLINPSLNPSLSLLSEKQQ